MGVDELTEEPLPVDESLTVADLVDIYGKEAVRRGLSYITNMDKANEEYIKNTQEKDLEEGLSEAGVEAEDDEMNKITSKWADKSREKGLGLDG